MNQVAINFFQSFSEKLTYLQITNPESDIHKAKIEETELYFESIKDKSEFQKEEVLASILHLFKRHVKGGIPALRPLALKIKELYASIYSIDYFSLTPPEVQQSIFKACDCLTLINVTLVSKDTSRNSQVQLLDKLFHALNQPVGIMRKLLSYHPHELPARLCDYHKMTFETLPSNLTSLFLDHLNPSSKAFLEYLPSSRLKTLHITFNRLLNNSNVGCLPNTLKNLTILFHFTLEKLTGECLKDLPKLTSLDLRSDNTITDENLLLLPKSLISLRLDSNGLITDSGIETLPPDLTELSLLSNNNLTDIALTRLPKSLKSLRLLSATQFTPNGLNIFSSHNLNILHLNPIYQLLSLPKLEKSRQSSLTELLLFDQTYQYSNANITLKYPLHGSPKHVMF